MAASSENRNSDAAGGANSSGKQVFQAAGLTARQLRENCNIARANLDTIETNSRIRIIEKGETRYLAPEEIEAK